MMFCKDEKIRLTLTGNRDFSDYSKFCSYFWNGENNPTEMLYDMCHASDDVSSMVITYSKVGAGLCS